MSVGAAKLSVRKVIAQAAPEPPAGTFSNCLAFGNAVYVSGQHAGVANGVIGGDDVFEQSREALRRIIALVEAAGGRARDIIKLTVYLTDMSRKADVSRARREFFEEPMPCSTLIGVNALVAPELLVEIDALAALQI